MSNIITIKGQKFVEREGKKIAWGFKNPQVEKQIADKLGVVLKDKKSPGRPPKI